MIEVKFLDLESIVIQSEETMHLSDANDPRWAGVLVFPARALIRINVITRTDIYVVKGTLHEQGRAYIAGTFLSRSGDVELFAGGDGVIVFMYRDGRPINSENTTISPDALEWYDAGADGMRAATLSSGQQRVSLVSWKPGTKIKRHAHPFGEEIFVLKGELCDQRGRYPTGTWLRLHPDANHSPYAEIDTVILLRNGHLGS